MTYLLAPSLLAADPLCLGNDIDAVMQAGADMLHLDIMDNHYVPNLSFSPALCKAIRARFPEILLDVHLMVQPVDAMITAFAKAGASRISIHPDASIHSDRSLEYIRELGCEAGIALNPATPPDCLAWCIHRLDFILVMTVNPGFGGQTLIHPVIRKIEQIHRKYPDLPICVDGGITEANIAAVAKAGARQFVAGSAIFGASDYAAAISALRSQLKH